VIGWLAAGAGCILVAVYVINLFRSGQFSVGGALLGLVLGLLIIGLVAVVGVARVRSLVRRYPHAFVSNVAMYPQLHLQLREISDALGVDASNLRSVRSASMVMDDTSLRIFAGLPLRQILALPSTAIASINVARAPQGKWVLPSLEVVFSFQGRTLPLDFCLGNSNFRFPHAVGRVELDRKLAVAREALVTS
jgi:hypothetical protein